MIALTPQKMKKKTIPRTALAQVTAQVAHSFAGTKPWPGILGFFGAPGIGKSWTLRQILEELHVHWVSLGATDFQDGLEGGPVRKIMAAYQQRCEMLEGRLDRNTGVRAQPLRSALIIDDFDRILGRHGPLHQISANPPGIVKLFQDIVDFPENLYRFSHRPSMRLPIFATLNDCSLLPASLTRSGRMWLIHFKFGLQTRLDIMSNFFPTLTSEEVVVLSNEFPHEPISFFGDLAAIVSSKLSMRSFEGLADFQNLVEMAFRGDPVEMTHQATLEEIIDIGNDYYLTRQLALNSEELK